MSLKSTSQRNREGNGNNYQSNSNNQCFQGNNQALKNQGNKTSGWVGDKLFEETSMNYLLQSRIFKDLNIKSIIKDRTRQLQGIDVIGEWQNIPINIDVKSIASQLGTFCFEISGNVSSGQVGWLLNDSLLTDYYLIVYHEVEGAPNNYRLGKRIMTNTNIIETEALLIKKETLKQRIEQEMHIPLDEVVSRIREGDFTHKKSVVRFDRNLNEVKGSVKELIYPTLSAGLKEQPINVVIRKSVLLEIAEKHWVI